MTLEEFLAEAKSTAVYPGAGSGDLREFGYLALGLAGESGEVADCVKKILRLGEVEAASESNLGYVRNQKVEAVGELGDVLYYWVMLCEALGVSPQEVMQANVRKLQGRKAAGKLKVR